MDTIDPCANTVASPAGHSGVHHGVHHHHHASGIHPHSASHAATSVPSNPTIAASKTPSVACSRNGPAPEGSPGTGPDGGRSGTTPDNGAVSPGGAADGGTTGGSGFASGYGGNGATPVSFLGRSAGTALPLVAAGTVVAAGAAVGTVVNAPSGSGASPTSSATTETPLPVMPTIGTNPARYDDIPYAGGPLAPITVSPSSPDAGLMATPVPEPSSVALFAVAVAVMALVVGMRSARG